MPEEPQVERSDTVELATELTIAWFSNPNVRATADEVPGFLKSIHATLGELDASGNGAVNDTVEYTPAVSPRASVKHDYIVSLITGQKLKSLKRHLTAHGLTPAEYRERYGLKPDYPMVAPAYSQARREVAKKLGLGRKPGQSRAKASEATSAPAADAAPAKGAPRRAAKPKSAPKSTANGAPAKKAPAKRGRAGKGNPSAAAK